MSFINFFNEFKSHRSESQNQDNKLLYPVKDLFVYLCYLREYEMQIKWTLLLTELSGPATIQTQVLKTKILTVVGPLLGT